MLHILAAEDDKYTRRLLEIMLNKAGYSVVLTEKEQDAINALDSQQAQDLHAVGPAARAAGICVDVRRDFPTVFTTGPVTGRVLSRPRTLEICRVSYLLTN